MIKIKNGYFENWTAKAKEMEDLITEKDFTAVTSYGLTLALDKAAALATPYFKAKQLFIEKNAVRHEEDGEGFKKGDIVATEDGRVTVSNPQGLQELMDTDVDLGMEYIEVDLTKEPNMSVADMRLIMPFIKCRE